MKTASTLAEKMHDQFEQAGSACLFGDIATAMGQYEQAAQYYRASLAAYRAMDERLPLAKTMLHYGRLLLQERSDVARGAHFLQEAAMLYSGLDNQPEYLKVILAIRRFGVGQNIADTTQAHSKSSTS